MNDRPGDLRKKPMRVASAFLLASWVALKIPRVTRLLRLGLVRLLIRAPAGGLLNRRRSFSS